VHVDAPADEVDVPGQAVHEVTVPPRENVFAAHEAQALPLTNCPAAQVTWVHEELPDVNRVNLPKRHIRWRSSCKL
jgi:hypothetical protein